MSISRAAAFRADQPVPHAAFIEVRPEAEAALQQRQERIAEASRERQQQRERDDFDLGR